MFHHEGLINRRAHVHQDHPEEVGYQAQTKPGREPEQDQEGYRQGLGEHYDLDLAITIGKSRRHDKANAHRQGPPGKDRANHLVRLMVDCAEKDVHKGHNQPRANRSYKHGQEELGEYPGVFAGKGDRGKGCLLIVGKFVAFEHQPGDDGKDNKNS